MTAVRGLGLSVVLLLAVVLQVAVFSAFSVEGVVPNLALVVVVAAALVRGPEFAAAARFRAPGSRSTWPRPPTTSPGAGRWRWWSSATSPAGSARTPAPRALGALVTVAACSFVGTSVFALTGMLAARPGDPGRRGAAGDPGVRGLRRRW